MAKYLIDIDTVDDLRKFEVKDDDTFLVGFPRTGTTWCQEMVWLIGNGINFEEASKRFIDERFPLFEYFSVLRCTLQQNINPILKFPDYHIDSLNFIKKQKGPRFIKSHLSTTYLPQQIQDGTRKPKIIYITRDPKDVCFSYYHFVKDLLKADVGSQEDLCDEFMNDMLHTTPFWDHALYFWHRRNESNILFLTYEDLKQDLAKVIRQVAKFLEKPITEEQLGKLLEWLSFESIKKNHSVNHDHLYKEGGFIRQGIVGGFKKGMSEDTIRKFDEWTRHHLEGTGLDEIYCI